MSRATARRLAFIVAGLVLLVGPLVVRTAVLGYNRRAYRPPEMPALSAPAEPAPTAIPLARSVAVSTAVHDLRRGPVVVDLAHGNRVTRNQYEPLAAALASRGVGLRYWMSDIDPMRVTSFLDYPNQSEELQRLLRGASGLVVVSPFFLWSKAEIAAVEQFVADGGRLLLISDPDVVGDLAQDINNLGEPFGVVFAGDYLYDTSENDENHVYVFASDFVDSASSLAGSHIALYGARSISGEVTPQVVTSSTTLSNLREGLSGLSAVVRGGLASRGTQNGVLAMGDFDVLTSPFIERHDNARLTEFVADFLVSGQRTQRVTDFPAFLGKEITLVLANAAAVDSQMLKEGSRLQKNLEESGRTLSVAGTGLLTSTVAGSGESSDKPASDLLVLADFAMADAKTTLLKDLGYTLVVVTPTPRPAETATAAPVHNAEISARPTPPSQVTASPAAGEAGPATPTGVATATATESTASDSSRRRLSLPRAQEQPTEEAALDPSPAATQPSTPTVTATPTPTTAPTASPAASPTSAPQPEFYLVAQDGLRLVAADTVLIVQKEMEDERRVVAVLGHDSDGIRSGIDRLLSGAYSGCVTSEDLAVCSDPNGGEGVTTASNAAHAANTPAPGSDAKPARQSDVNVMVVDDDDVTLAGEESEADIYLQVLTRQGYGPTLWSTAADGVPKAADLDGYDWVIWSSGGYEAGGPGLEDMDALLSYGNGGGALTISSRRPFFGMSAHEPSAIVDVAVDDDLPPMIQGLPSTAIRLENGLPPVTPLEIGEEQAGAKIVLMRGSDSANAGAPLLYVVNDDKGDDATNARLMIAGIPLTWLPEDYSERLVRNMVGYMTGD